MFNYIFSNVTQISRYKYEQYKVVNKKKIWITHALFMGVIVSEFWYTYWKEKVIWKEGKMNILIIMVEIRHFYFNQGQIPK